MNKYFIPAVVAAALPLMFAPAANGQKTYNIEDLIKVHPKYAQKNNAEDKRIVKNGKYQYIIQFKDAPVTTYHGGLDGLAATSLQGSYGVNATTDNKLNVQSNATQAYLSYLDKKQGSAVQAMTSAVGHSLEIESKFRLAINGVVTYLTEKEADRVAQLPHVAHIKVSEKHELQTYAGPEWIGAGKAWEGTAHHVATKGENIIVGIMDTGINPFNASFSDTPADGYEYSNPFPTYNYDPLGVYHKDKEGEDTGGPVGGCLVVADHCNDKVVGIFANDLFLDYYEEEFDLPRIGLDYHAHGSHVASTVAGNAVVVPIYNHAGDASVQNVNISGVAPHATIISYAVCVPVGGCHESATLSAIEHAISVGVDVLNYSVGGGADNPWNDPAALAFLNASKAGIHMANSAGNNGRSGSGTIGSPSSAPWAFSVAAASHDAAFTPVELTLSGGDAPLATITGEAITSALSEHPIVFAGDYDEDGEGLCLEPFAEGTFDGKIVICKRGAAARVTKGSNVLAGGAVGFVLANADASADDIYADPHSLPAIHINSTHGAALLSWLQTGSEHKAAISASEQVSDPDVANIVAAFSSRGPNPFPWNDSSWLLHPNADRHAIQNLLKPQITGPGVNIYAANAHSHPIKIDGDGYEGNSPEHAQVPPYRYMSGTSMSAPHIAGALALLKSMRPDLTVPEMQSAIMMTANQDMVAEFMHRNTGELYYKEANFFDMGAGMIDIEKASRAALVLDVNVDENNVSDYERANPWRNLDGEFIWEEEPEIYMHELNLSSLTRYQCIIECDWQRTLKATKAGNWTVSVEYITDGVDITLDAEQINLSVGEEVSLNITASLNANTATDWQFANLVLTSQDTSLPVQRIPMAISFVPGMVPDQLTMEVSKDSGSLQFGPITAGNPQSAVFKLLGFDKAEYYETTTEWYETEKPHTIDSFYDGAAFTVKPGTKTLIIDIVESTSPDVDLFISYDLDSNGVFDGKADAMNDVLCFSWGSDSNERCIIENPRVGYYIAATHNYQGSEENGTDTHKLAITQVKDSTENTSVSVPTDAVAKEGFYLDANYNFPMISGESYYGVLTSGTSVEEPENIGITLIRIERADSMMSVTTEQELVLAGAPLAYSISLNANNSDTVRNGTLSVTLPEGIEAELADGMSLDGQTLSWAVEQLPNSDAQTHELVLDTTAVDTLTLLELEVSFIPSNNEEERVIASLVTIESLPVALINGNSSGGHNLAIGDKFTLDASSSETSFTDDNLTYSWTQVSGPELALAIDGENSALASFTAPEVTADTGYGYELVVANERHSSAAASISFTVAAPAPAPEKGSSGGSMFYLSMLALFSLFRRR